jgi:hypothetical protein
MFLVFQKELHGLNQHLNKLKFNVCGVYLLDYSVIYSVSKAERIFWTINYYSFVVSDDCRNVNTSSVHISVSKKISHSRTVNLLFLQLL